MICDIRRSVSAKIIDNSHFVRLTGSSLSVAKTTERLIYNILFHNWLELRLIFRVFIVPAIVRFALVFISVLQIIAAKNPLVF